MLTLPRREQSVTGMVAFPSLHLVPALGKHASNIFCSCHHTAETPGSSVRKYGRSETKGERAHAAALVVLPLLLLLLLLLLLPLTSHSQVKISPAGLCL